MSKKPELLVTAGSFEELKRYIEAGADAVAVGEETYGLRLPGNMVVKDLEQAVPWAHEHGAKIYGVVNHLFDNERANMLDAYLIRLHELKVDGVVFGDPAVIMAIQENNLNLPLHWNTEMTTTNYETANYWGKQGAVRAVLARELNLEEVLEFKKHAKVEVQVQVHGMTNIYHSKRDLLHVYASHQGKNASHLDTSKERGLFLIEHERREEKLPVYEDSNGTHVMSSDDICMLEDLHELLAGEIDSLKIECLLKSPEYNETVIRSHRAAIDSYAQDPESYVFKEEWLEQIQQLQDPDRELTFGFFYKEQVY